jgi:5-methylcytosine-specific restriction endonuclease McrA
MPRTEFSRKTRRDIFLRAMGRCEQCRAYLKSGEGEYDHILPCELGGEATVDNGMLLCRTCHRIKTRGDVQQIRKSDRQRDKNDGTFVKSGKKLSHPRFKRRMDGTVVDKRTGEIISGARV